MTTKQEESVAIGVMSIVCSLASYAILGIVLAPLGIVLGCVALRKGETNKTLGIVGIIIGAIAVAILLFSLFLASSITLYRR